MKAIRSLKPDDLLLVGRLKLEPSSSPTSPPWISIVVRCPSCRKTHQHGWDAKLTRLDVAIHCTDHCDPGKGATGGYWISQDPSHGENNRRVLAEFPETLARWEAKYGPRLPRGSGGMVVAMKT